MVFNVHSSGDTDWGLSYFSWCVGLVFNVHPSGDRDCGYHVLGGELAWFAMYACLVTQSVVYLVSDGQLT